MIVRPLQLLHSIAIRGQLHLVLATIPVSAVLVGFGVEPMLTDAVLSDGPAATEPRLHEAFSALLLLVIGVVGVGTAGASLLLRGSLRAVVEELTEATRAIARGDLAHRVDSPRRDELGALAGAIDAMAGRLEAIEDARHQLLACVSHELRTPLTIIRGHAFTLGRDEPEPARLARLELMQEEAARLALLIEDLVDTSSIRAGSIRLRTERVDLRELVQVSATRLHSAASDRDVCIEVRGDRRGCWIDADPDRIGQVLANLLANAIRHATAGSAVRVTCRQRGDSEVVVAVSNVGTAIAPADAARIFEPFEQGGRACGRLGLGLAIARGLALAHGGRLVLADPDAAATGDVRFELVVPAAGAEAVAPAGIVADDRRRRPQSSGARYAAVQA
ncbi:MAG: integral rane sensor signal transduction histidine kinase [Thermoleophilia bacterium]|nr:integral rane sensor signal transduction histidine kinase [Thermoleophilia bacterium]